MVVCSPVCPPGPLHAVYPSHPSKGQKLFRVDALRVWTTRSEPKFWPEPLDQGVVSWDDNLPTESRLSGAYTVVPKLARARNGHPEPQRTAGGSRRFSRETESPVGLPLVDGGCCPLLAPPSHGSGPRFLREAHPPHSR